MSNDLKPGSVAWVEAIVSWVAANRPDHLQNLKTFVYHTSEIPDQRMANGIMAMMHFGFEAGRNFQRRNPTVEPGPIDPKVPITTYDLTAENDLAR